jgi:HEAT repeat protein
MRTHTIRLVLGLFSGATLCVQAQFASPQEPADVVVQQLRDLPTPIPHCCNGPSTPGQPLRKPESEIRRENVYRQLRDMGAEGVQGLARAYRDPDVRLRRNAALALLFLGGGYGTGAPVDVTPALVALTNGLRDSDSDVRAWSAQAIGHIGASATPAVPQLIELLNGDEAARNSACIALRKIGPNAAAALPSLRRALSDPSEDVRRFAELAIEAIERQ